MTQPEKVKKFIKKNGTYLLKYFKPMTLSIARTRHPKQIQFWIDKARVEIGYKGKDGDIYRSLYKACRQSS